MFVQPPAQNRVTQSQRLRLGLRHRPDDAVAEGDGLYTGLRRAQQRLFAKHGAGDQRGDRQPAPMAPRINCTRPFISVKRLRFTSGSATVCPARRVRRDRSLEFDIVLAQLDEDLRKRALLASVSHDVPPHLRPVAFA